MICAICGKEIKGGYFQANVNKDLKSTDKGDTVCSAECRQRYEEYLPYQGQPLQHWSRITGYYQNIKGWNKGKLQELKDRQKYSIK